MGFKYRKGVGVSYERQGFIYFYSLKYKSLPLNERLIIDKVCAEVGGEYTEALFEAVTTTKPAHVVADMHFLGAATLWRKIKEYYKIMDRII